ncbi:hypothetical protein IMSAG044_00627 [Lactobacillaceae bacterium]|nr:hypothetical protein IMSAG044_00627 [Lactobacillaceae bacterium]
MWAGVICRILPTSIAANALLILYSPTIGIVNSSSGHSLTVNDNCRGSSWTLVAYKLLLSCRPKRICRWVRSFTRSSNNGSSPLNTSVPSSFRPWAISIFASAILSRVPKNSICASPIIVITAMSGFTSLLKKSSWPKRSMPISTTTASVLDSMLRSVTGTPISLLKLAYVFVTLNCVLKIDAIISLVVVLPLLPVTATTIGLILCK